MELITISHKQIIPAQSFFSNVMSISIFKSIRPPPRFSPSTTPSLKPPPQISSQSLLDLPNDILFIILDLLESSYHSRQISPQLRTQLRDRDMINLSLTCHCLRRLSHRYLFRRLHLGPSWSAEHTIATCHDIEHYPELANHVQELTVGLWLGGSPGHDLSDIASQALVNSLPRRIAAVTTHLHRVRKFTFSFMADDTDAFRGVFRGSGIVLPSIHELVLGPRAHWLIGICPNVTSISTNDWLYDEPARSSLLQAASRVRGLCHFGMHAHWCVWMLESLQVSLPDITGLSLTGGMFLDRLEACVPVLQRFPNLEMLRMMDAHLLITGRAPLLPSCSLRRGDITLSPRMERYLKDLVYQQDHAARVLFSGLSGLQELWLGDYHISRRDFWGK